MPPPTGGFADWRHALPSWDWHALVAAGFPGWELPPGKDEPARVDFVIVKGRDRSSREIAVEWDDHATYAFYYRDWTDDNLPFVDDGEAYRSAFWFASLNDANAFRARYVRRGTPSPAASPSPRPPGAPSPSAPPP